MEEDIKTRIPLEHKGIQYNFCKNPKCSNFGVPASQEKKYGNNTYGLTGLTRADGTTNIPLLRCNCCGEHLPMKSNHGINEELERVSSYLQIATEHVCCSNPECPNKVVPVGTKKAYRSFGSTAGGAKRYRCNLCKKTVSIAKATQGQHDTHQNIEIFKLITNKMRLNRIIEVTGVSWAVLYNRIDHIHKQCISFASNRENKLKDMDIEKLYISVDRQEYTINWTERKDKRNIVLSGVASADNSTGYIFGINPNFDQGISKDDLSNEVFACQDHLKTPPFRKFARIWLDKDYEDSIGRAKKRKKTANNLVEEIANTYEHVAQRDDIEGFDSKTITEKLPDYGVQIHAEYTMIAHFHLLKKLMPNVGKWRFFLDQDSGIRGAFMSSFVEEVKNHTAEAFYVKIEKDLTVDEKRKLTALAKKKFNEVKNLNPNLSENEVKIELLKQEIQANVKVGNWADSWVHHPFPDYSESNKAMCWLTEHDTFDLTHKAWLYNKASLHAVDNFFQNTRRRVAMLERPIHSASSAGRTWNGYGAYNPAMVVKLLEIFRVVHNYIPKKKEKTTPAMKFGLAEAPLSYKTVLYNE